MNGLKAHVYYRESARTVKRFSTYVRDKPKKYTEALISAFGNLCTDEKLREYYYHQII